MDFPKVAIIVLNWNGWKDTIECLESVFRIDYPNYQVIVVDNGSTDDSVEKIKAWYSQKGIILNEVNFELGINSKIHSSQPSNSYMKKNSSENTILRLSENTGFCSGNNLGMGIAAENGADYFLILNNDTLVEPNFLTPMVSLAQENFDIGLVGGVILYAREPDKIWFTGGAFSKFLRGSHRLQGRLVTETNLPKIIASDWVTGCMMLIPRRVYNIIGGFYEPFFIGDEDMEYSLRVKEAGYRISIATDSRIYHKIGSSFGILTPVRYYYGTRNRLFIKKMHLQVRKRLLFLAFFFLSRIPRYFIFVCRGRLDLVRAGFSAIIDYFNNRSGKWQNHDD